jgi:hypothetical protein
LKATIDALRQELEISRLDGEAQRQQALASASDQITQLRATVTALREQLEHGNAG